MSTSNRKGQLLVFGPPNKAHNPGDRAVGSAAAKRATADLQKEALLRVIPDQVFRLRAKDNGSVSVVDHRTGIRFTADGVVGSAKEDQLGASTIALGREIARRGKDVMESFLQTENLLTVELQIDCDGLTTSHEMRAGACGPWELMAVVRDVTARREAEASIARCSQELARLNEVLENEASLHAEDEEILDSAFTKLGKLLEDTIGAIQMIVQKKDPPTAYHQARVCKLSCAIGREMGLGKGQVDTIGLAALLHDLGKVFIPSDTLNKPGKLTEEEFASVKSSAETEFQILKMIDLFYPVADIVHQHHERLDGSGYPLGLRDGEILIEARIIAVADVVEAMVSERPYRPALTLESALGEIAGGRGVLYDADAVDACLRLFKENRFGFDRPESQSALEPAHSGCLDSRL